MKILIKYFTGFAFLMLNFCPEFTTGQVIKNYPKSEYGAANQNWSVATGKNGFIYFANHKGLLEFDGVNWNLMQLPNEALIRIVFVDADSLIYTAGYREFGFWKENENRKLEYFSLNNLAEKYFSKNDEFWNIAKQGDNIYFQSFDKLLAYNGNRITPVAFPGIVNTMKQVGNEIVVAVQNNGLFKIAENIARPFLTDPVFENTVIKFIHPYNGSQLLIGTSSKGIFVWDGVSLKPWNDPWTNYFIQNEVNRAFIAPDGKIVIGTISDGVLIFDKPGNNLAHFHTGNGLQNNTILGITGDNFGNTWLALDNGIDFISADKNYTFEFEKVYDVGSVYDLAFFEERLYLGTNQGLFYRDLEDKHGEFNLVPETQGQVWFCKQIDNFLFVGYNGGLLSVKNGVVHLLSSQAGGFDIKEDPFAKDRYIASTYNDLVSIKKDGTEFHENKVIPGFSDLIRYIEFDHRGNLWASHMHRGIFRLQFNTTRDSILTTSYFNHNSIFKKEHNLAVFKIENRIVFTSGDSLFTYDDIADEIIPYTSLSKQVDIFAKAHRIIEAPDHHYWFITQNEIGLFHIYSNLVEMVNILPKSLLASNSLIDDFENIYPISSNKAILCLENGILPIELQPMQPSDITEYSPLLRKITLSGARVDDTEGIENDGLITIKYKHQNIRLQYAFPYFTHYPVYFKSMLKGFDNHWSGNRLEAVFSFDRLPGGTYELLVKAVDPWGNESLANTVKLEVLPPFYLSKVAKAGYAILTLALFFGLQAHSIRRTRKKERRRLEKREQELTLLRNEKLRDEVEFKSKELANLTMAITKKNEFLISLKEILSRQREQLGSRYPDKYFNHITRKIDENIASRDDWNLFEVNFERAHEQFLNNVRNQYPDLTPKDLRLCAFLRMNLSSKEIAPLMGISVRGVENHRYRLRKKMNLEHDDNLIEMILKL